MNILLQTKEDAEAHFGQKATIAISLLGMVNRGERAFGFLTGSMRAWRCCVKKKWKREVTYAVAQLKRSFIADYVERKGDQVLAEATGWQSDNRVYAFVYVPDVPGEIGLMPDKTALDQKFPGTGAIVKSRKFAAFNRRGHRSTQRATKKRKRG